MRIKPEDLAALVSYDPNTGALTWLPRDSVKSQSAVWCAVWNKKFAGTPAFSVRDNGYLSGACLGRTIRAHRVAWAIHYGVWPDEIDHINGDRADNRITNLRSVSHAENARNCCRSIRNTSGVVGVCLPKGRRIWQAEIRRDGKTVRLGHFKTFEAAVAARRAAEREVGYHPNHGRPPLRTDPRTEGNGAGVGGGDNKALNTLFSHGEPR